MMRELLARHNPFSWGVSFLIRETGADGTVFHGTNVILEKMEHPGRQIIEPTFELEPEAMQKLFDDFWKMGFRPTGEKLLSSTVSATEKHLEDMREIAFAKLELKKP